MRAEIYQLESKDSMMIFEFVSQGPKGNIRKRIQYEMTSQEDVYNLAFGDVNFETDDIDDKSISDNNDRTKVLATVAETVTIFLNKYPNAYIYAKGSNLTRTRLYRISISNHLEEINKQFEVYGLLGENNWVIYEKNNNYSAFVIKNK